MLKNVDNLDPKSRLVIEICAASAGCAYCSGTDEDGSVDWNLLLRLHPDKNSHRHAEVAFKLISQAYKCLSGDLKRRAFDLDRSCLICNNILNKSRHHSLGMKTEGLRLNSQDKSKSSRFWRGWKEIGERFKMEEGVIENCLKSNTNMLKK